MTAGSIQLKADWNSLRSAVSPLRFAAPGWQNNKQKKPALSIFAPAQDHVTELPNSSFSGLRGEITNSEFHSSDNMKYLSKRRKNPTNVRLEYGVICQIITAIRINVHNVTDRWTYCEAGTTDDDSGNIKSPDITCKLCSDAQTSLLHFKASCDIAFYWSWHYLPFFLYVRV